jgi:hypothetical protein
MPEEAPMHPMMTLPEMMRLSYRMAFLTFEMQMTLAARLWGFSKKVQDEAKAIAEELPATIEVVLAPLTEAAAAANADSAPAAEAPGIGAPAAPAPRRPRTRRAAAAEARLN